MLPQELLLEVCSHLSQEDTVSLAETCKDNHTALSAIRHLFIKSPYARLNLSQWNDWSNFAENYEETVSDDLFTRVQLTKHVNQPLPQDFKALQGDLSRQWNSEWNCCDNGIAGGREDGGQAEVLDLTKNTEPVTSSGLNTTHKRRLFTDHFQVGYKFNSLGEGLLEWNTGSDAVTLYTMFSDGVLHTTVVDRRKGMNMHHLQLIDNIAFVFVTGMDAPTTYYLVPGGTLTPLNFNYCPVPQEGLLMFNGHVYKAVIDECVDIQVAHVTREMGSPTTMTPGAGYEICQDLRYPRYGLVYTNIDQNLAHVIDLQKREISQFFGFDKDVCLVGLSEGKLGVWRYTRDYLDKVCEDRDKLEFKRVVGKLFENNENWKFSHRYLVESWT